MKSKCKSDQKFREITYLDGFLLFLVFVGFVFVFIFADILNFGLVIFALLFVLFHFLLLGFVIRNFLVAFLLNQKFDGITNELGVFLDHILDTSLFIVFSLIFLQVQNDLGTTTERFRVIGTDGEGST